MAVNSNIDLNVFIGYNAYQKDVYGVCKSSIWRYDVPPKCTGTISASLGTPTTVTGHDTKFTTELSVGQKITIVDDVSNAANNILTANKTRTIASIESDTSLTVSSAYTHFVDKKGFLNNYENPPYKTNIQKVYVDHSEVTETSRINYSAGEGPDGRGQGKINDLWTRVRNEFESTNHALARFLVPLLSDYEGYSIYMDDDFLWTVSIRELLQFIDPDKAVHVVKHDYTPKNSSKLDGKTQTTYDKKNWSSLMVFNNAHADCKNLTFSNIQTKSAMWMHQLEWTSPSNTGELPVEYNYLVGEYDDTDITPKAIHYTNGGPWLDAYKDCKYANLWNEQKQWRIDHNNAQTTPTMDDL